MNSWPVVAVFLECLVLVISLVDFSNFRATKVLYQGCSRTGAFSVFVYKRRFVCAFECSQNIKCRRMMICTHPDEVECSLFHEGENCATLQPTNCSCFMKTYSKVNNTEVCPLGLYGDYCENTIKDCTEGKEKGLRAFSAWFRSYIKPLSSTTAFEVVCDIRYGGHTFIMSRSISCQDVSFNRNITEYINGFGDPNGDYWLGLTRMKEILDNRLVNKLSVMLIKGTTCQNNYDTFSIGAAADGYPVYIGEPWSSSKCGDSLTGNVNIDLSPFSAPGSDQTSFNCSDQRQGGWWYANDSRCSECDFMGSLDAMLWPTFLNGTPLSFVSLRIF